MMRRRSFLQCAGAGALTLGLRGIGLAASAPAGLACVLTRVAGGFAPEPLRESLDPERQAAHHARPRWLEAALEQRPFSVVPNRRALLLGIVAAA